MDKVVRVVLEVGGRDSEEVLDAGVISLIEKEYAQGHVKQTKQHEIVAKEIQTEDVV